jgi:hypothetical protein
MTPSNVAVQGLNVTEMTAAWQGHPLGVDHGEKRRQGMTFCSPCQLHRQVRALDTCLRELLYTLLVIVSPGERR